MPRPLSICFVLAVCGCFSFAGAGENEDARFAIGVELQAYPVGVIPGVHARFRLSNRDVLTLRGGYNATDRGDAGEHLEEEGGGPGASVGYRRYLKPGLRGWSVGARFDVWSMEIDWEDPGTPTPRVGTTDMIVLQPVADAGYTVPLGRSGWMLDTTLSLGAEINVNVDGEDVGEGAILLGGVTFLRRF